MAARPANLAIVAEGPMKVDSQRMREIGIIVYRDNSWWHDFDKVKIYTTEFEIVGC